MIAHQRQVHEDRRLETEILIDEDVLRNRGEPFLAARHMGDLHQVVVHHIRHMVGRHAVGLQQHLHVDGFPRDFDRAVDAVDELARALGRDLHAHDMRLAGLDALRHFLGGKVEAKAVIFRRLAGGALRLAHLLQPLGRAEAAEGMALVQQFLAIGLIHVLAVGLAVGTVGAADIRAFRPFEAAPFQRVQHLLLEFRRRARGVRVLDAQDEGAVVLFRKEVVEQRDIGGADMRLAGRGGCDADADAGSAHG